MSWKPHSPRAVSICLVAALAAVGVSLRWWDSVGALVGLPFAAFCFLNAGLVAVNLRWTTRVLAVVPGVIVACAVFLWFALEMGSVPGPVAGVVAFFWALVLFLLTLYCKASAEAAQHSSEADSLRAARR